MLHLPQTWPLASGSGPLLFLGVKFKSGAIFPLETDEHFSAYGAKLGRWI